MKRYLLFAGSPYTSLGWDDLFKGDFNTAEEARRAIGGPDMSPTDWFEIIDTDTKKVVKAGTVYRWLENREG